MELKKKATKRAGGAKLLMRCKKLVGGKTLGPAHFHFLVEIMEGKEGTRSICTDNCQITGEKFIHSHS